jgi:hypothetical protein
MRLRSLFIVVSLVALLALAVAGALHMWSSIGGPEASGAGSNGPGLNGPGTTALILGAVGSLILGGGLMALVFFSSRRGYDDRADPGKQTGADGHGT